MKALRIVTVSLVALGTAVAANAQNFASVNTQAENDLRDAEKELSSLRNQIANEKIPISRRLTELENQVQQERREFDRVVSTAENVSVDLNALGDKVKKRSDQNVFIKNQLSAYIKQFNTRIHVAELQDYKSLIDESEQIMDRNDASDAEKFAAQIEVIKASITRVEKIIGGHQFRGSALGASKREVEGNYVLAGPYGFFGDSDQNIGFAQSKTNSAFPVVSSSGLEPEVVSMIASLTEAGSGTMPVDTTLGDAMKLAQLEETTIEHIKKGGDTMYFILGLAFAALCVAIFKLFEINSVKRPKPGALQQILDNINGGNKQQALEIANSVDGPFGDLLVSAVEHADQEKELLEEVLYERLLAAQPKLERFLAFIALTAAAAPLLGLLGTVTGMINTFKLITVFGTGDAKSLSTGISEALVTTEYGLLVAIPALLAQALLTKLAKGKLGEMEQSSVAFVNGLNRK